VWITQNPVIENEIDGSAAALEGSRTTIEIHDHLANATE
jgi:hypothetical protein